MTPDALSEAYDFLLDINVKGSFFGAKAALEELQKTNGNIIFSVSGASFYPDGGGVWYKASKHAQIGLMRQLAFELAPNIRVNAVAPGGTLTALSVIPPLHPLKSWIMIRKQAVLKNEIPFKSPKCQKITLQRMYC